MIFWFFCIKAKEQFQFFKRKTGEKRRGRHIFAPEDFVRMIRFWLLSLIGLLASAEGLRAQVWSREDSVRLANILSGKDTLRLNPEFQRAIQDGTFINAHPTLKMQETDKSDIPIIKDFSDYIRPDEKTLYDGRSSVIIPQMPPQAAIRQLEPAPKEKLRMNPQAFSIPGVSKRTPMQGIGTDFNHVLSYLFSKKYRQHVKNRQRAASWKYNDLPSSELYRKQKAFRGAHPELIHKPDSIKPLETLEYPQPAEP